MVDISTLTKRYYTIGEVADMYNETSSVIRYWENNIPGLNAYKDARGTRRFTKKHIEKINKVYYLIKEKGYTLDGAIQALTEESDKLDIRIKTEKNLIKLKRYLVNLRESIE